MRDATSRSYAFIVAAALVAAAACVRRHARRAPEPGRARRAPRAAGAARHSQGNVDLLNRLTQLQAEVQALRASDRAAAARDRAAQEARSATSTSTSMPPQRGSKAARRAAPLRRARAADRSSADADRAGHSPRKTAARDDRRRRRRPTTGPPAHRRRRRTAIAADERRPPTTPRSTRCRPAATPSRRAVPGASSGLPERRATPPNALYWLGESYYVTQNYQLALDSSSACSAAIPTHDKAPGRAAQGRLLSQYELQGRSKPPRRTLTEVVARYPGTDARAHRRRPPARDRSSKAARLNAAGSSAAA